MSSPSVAVVIPFFRSEPLWYEELAIRQAIDVLGKHPHIILAPASLSLSQLQNWYNNHPAGFTCIRVPDHYFDSTTSYNRLMLDAGFYQHLSQYTYHLIYQTDAYIFRDELHTWCQQGFDYVGAPWIDWIHTAQHAKNKSRWNQLLWIFGKRRFDAVGNGGLSLRKTQKLQSVLQQLQAQAAAYRHNEDFFFAFEAARLGLPLHIPSVQQALAFGFDERPKLAWQMNQQQLPMGCHGWPRHLNFWQDKHPTMTGLVPGKNQ